MRGLGHAGEAARSAVLAAAPSGLTGPGNAPAGLTSPGKMASGLTNAGTTQPGLTRAAPAHSGLSSPGKPVAVAVPGRALSPAGQAGSRSGAGSLSGSLAARLAEVPSVWWALAVLLLVMPAFANSFWLFQVFGWTFILGMIALSLMFLAGYGGMVSLVQMTIAGLGGYMVAILGTSGVETISLGLPWWLNIPLAIIIAAVFGTLVGALAVRTEGIYTIMITLAIASAFFYFTRQNYGIFNGYTGFNLVVPPPLFGVDWRGPTAFYYLSLGCAVLSWLLVVYVARSPFGLALQGVRDNPRRMAALGFNVTAHRIAAYTFASCIAACGGILLIWQNAMISPGTAGIPAVIDILVIAVVGGVRRPIGPFIGALIYVLLRTFSPDVLTAFGLSNERFKLLIGLGFLVVVFFSPDGVLGLWDRWKARRGTRDPLTGKERV